MGRTRQKLSQRFRQVSAIRFLQDHMLHSTAGQLMAGGEARLSTPDYGDIDGLSHMSNMAATVAGVGWASGSEPSEPAPPPPPPASRHPIGLLTRRLVARVNTRCA